MTQNHILRDINSLWVNSFFKPISHIHFVLDFKRLLYVCLMSAEFKFHNHPDPNASQGKVKVTDLISRLNQEKKIEKQRNLALSVAAVSAVSVFAIILTI
jgi:hypothetical protein